ncbi:LOW QUALITY PROTEIN: polycystic kidney disease protein 1-like 2 [Pomacea canaliculata]|uniref:LOW QUALITY PROTEIN: polycystic kidney disease protein 1-like 2 n=1 Tax=Pomacea canaliculata TaxID=400727 RepID=UPI000D72B152|nr:LOW QUALITY PROTEIN: polycystic kidney disease protein 1-like 2 [Pomacea canaliculata]
MAGCGQGQRRCRPRRSTGPAGRDHVLRQAVLGVHQDRHHRTHLWLSCFMRPAPSTFTRVQRVSCCLVLLLLTMITSAMFYKAEDSETGESANSLGMEVKVGFLRFSLTTLWTSSVSIVITSVPMMIFVLIFRNYRPLPGPRTKKHLKGKPPELTNVDEKPELKENTGKSEESQKDSVGTNLQSNLLPHYWCYIGWLLLVATAATCAFFLVLYSMQWGITTSEEWLTSFVISFFESIFVMDPIKVILLACLLAYCVQNPYANKSDSEHVILEPLQVEVSKFNARDSTALPPDPVPRKVLAQSRKRRLHEEKSQRVFFDLLFHIFFVFCVYSLSYGKRDVNAFFQNDHLDSLLFQSSGDAPFPFQSITKREEVMRWMKETMLPVLFPRRDSLGNSLQLRERVFTSDPTSFRVGPVRVRQLRMPFMERTRTVGGYSSLLGKRRYCPPYSMGQEETGMYCVGWKPLASCSYEERNTKLSRASWMYQSFEGISSLPVWGTYSVYSSGGYVMDFSVNWDVINLTLQELEENKWLDEQTRAVFVEFSLYNPDSNLFSYLRLLAEFPETGDTFLGIGSTSLPHLRTHAGYGFYMYICEIIAAAGIIIFTVKIALKIKQQKLGFFKDFWQVLDLGTVIICYVTVTFYAIKTMKVNESMAAWRDNPKKYVDFYQTAFWDNMYGYSLAAVVFITTIRLLRILGYNRRLTMIAAVLANSGRDLFGFSLVFAVVFVAYLSAGYIVFASTLSEFCSPWESAHALFQLLLGRNVLAAFSEDLALFAWVYFISYVILVFMILMTMFQAIVCGSSTIVRSEVSSVPPPYGLTNLFIKFYHTVIADLLPAWLTRDRSATGLTKVHVQSAGSTHSLGDRKLQVQKDPSTKGDNSYREQT